MTSPGEGPVKAPSGLVVVDKPAGWTSHDVVARLRRLSGTRRVGHAGTLDPMATGVLVVGVDKATRLLGHLALTDKAYDCVIRLGRSTTTDDAEGEVTATRSPAGLTEEAVRERAGALTGTIMQVPPRVSAIKVDGRRAYKRARAGEDVELRARQVTVSRFEVRAVRTVPGGPGVPDAVDVAASVTCSSGTYIRALARDLGEALGVGGHLTALRRTRVGPYGLEMARTLDQLAAAFEVVPLDDAVATAFPRRDVSAEEARLVSHGGRLPAAGLGPGPVGVFGPDGTLLALVRENGMLAKPLAVFVP